MVIELPLHETRRLMRQENTGLGIWVLCVNDGKPSYQWHKWGKYGKNKFPEGFICNLPYLYPDGFGEQEQEKAEFLQCKGMLDQWDGEEDIHSFIKLSGLCQDWQNWEAGYLNVALKDFLRFVNREAFDKMLGMAFVLKDEEKGNIMIQLK